MISSYQLKSDLDFDYLAMAVIETNIAGVISYGSSYVQSTLNWLCACNVQ